MQIAANDSTRPHHHPFSDELVRKAICLALELEGLLEAAATAGSFRVRLARAHALSAIDVLTGLALQQPAAE
jgi:hypothetical protein